LWWPAQFTASSTGLIKIIRAGQYKFFADARISIDNQDVTNKEVKLDEGDHPIAIEFTRKNGPARLLVEWQSEHFPLEPLPSSVLFHSDIPKQVREDEQISRGRLLAQCRRYAARWPSPGSAPLARKRSLRSRRKQGQLRPDGRKRPGFGLQSFKV